MPLVLGIATGVGLLLAAMGFGLGAALNTIPGFRIMLRIAGAAYIVWLAFRIATSGPLRVDDTTRPSMGFFGGVAFQWINPKAWAVTISSAAIYIPPQDHASNVILAAFVLTVVSIPCVGIWAIGGVALRQTLTHPKLALAFNLATAFILVLTTIPVMLSNHG